MKENIPQEKITWLSDIVSDDFKRWSDTKIIFDAGTGSGKTYFIINILAAYAAEHDKTILYLCNRKPLHQKLLSITEGHDNITVILYHTLQSLIRKGENIEHFDYIIADECHFLLSDSTFNEYTDLSYHYLMNQRDNVTIFMSATASIFFQDLINQGIVGADHVYSVPKRYDYVKKIGFYDGRDLTNIIDYIIEEYPDDKILVFVNSMNRLRIMYDTYGDTALYMCGKSYQGNPDFSFCKSNAIINDSFGSRILFTTKTLDNGVDIKDQRVRHIFSEIFDVDSCIQAIGRKRPISDNDYCSFYFKDYDKRALLRFKEANDRQLKPVQAFLKDREAFINDLYRNNQEPRQIARDNHIMYIDWKDNQQLKINYISLKKYTLNSEIISDMLDTSYRDVLLKYLGDELSTKINEIELTMRKKDIFLEYLKENCGCKLFKEDQKLLKDKFKNILGLRDRTMGINTLNGKLVDCMYKFKIISMRENSRKSVNYKQRYWMIVQND